MGMSTTTVRTQVQPITNRKGPMQTILRPLQGDGFDPASLGGLLGLWNNTVPSNLYQLSGGSTPVTAEADPVGYSSDLSGNGRHFTQATAGKRSLYYNSFVGPNRHNGGFETLGGGGADVFANWYEGTSGTSTVTAGAGRTGTYSCRLTGDGLNSLVYVQTVGLAFSPGRVYNYGFWAKTDVAGRTINLDEVGGVGVAGPFTLTTDWVYYSGTFTASTGQGLLFKRSNLTSASAWIDDVSITEANGLCNGYGGLLLDGTDDWYTMASPPTLTMCTAYFVIASVVGTVNRAVFSGAAGALECYIDTAGLVQVAIVGGAGIQVSNAPVVTSQPTILTIGYSEGAGSFVRINGTDRSGASAYGNVTAPTSAFGIRPATLTLPFSDYWFKGALYSTYQSLPEVLQMESYLRAKAGSAGP